MTPTRFTTPSAPALRTPAARRAGFSLIELLVVIGILVVLIALAVIGFRVVGTASREKVTNNQLENCKSLLGEFENSGASLGSLMATPLVKTDHWFEPPTPLAPLTAPTVLDATNCRVSAATTLPGAEAPFVTPLPSFIQDTARVLARLRSVPKNRAAIEAMSSDRIRGVSYPLLNIPNNAKVAGTSPSGRDLPAGDSVVLLDGNGFPIYFVPGAGLADVNRGYNGSGDRTAASSYDSPGGTIYAPDRRPFWASPGPDGDLTTGDDNLYSFGK